METFRLKSMVDFVLENAKQPYVEGTKYKDLVNYAKFLKQPLKLEMFVPCDEYGNFLEEPCDYKYWIKDDENGAYEGQNEYMCIKYQQAKEKVLFEGFEFNGKYVKYSEDWLYLDEEICEAETIEFLITYNINLTPNAIKNLGL